VRAGILFGCGFAALGMVSPNYVAFFWQIRRLVQSSSLRWRQSRLTQARQFIVRQNGRHIERT